MRPIPQALQDELDSGATTLCWCWRIIRQDGVMLGFTEHDADLVFDGLTWKASVGLRPGVIENAVGYATDTSQASGALNAFGVSRDDIDAGKYDQAVVEIWRVDWRNPALRVGVWSGEIGAITRTEHAFEAEISGPARKLRRSFGRVFSKRCDAELGDARCTRDVSAAPFARQAVITRLAGAAQFAVAALAPPDADWFCGGTVLWQSGANAGLSARIAQYVNAGAEDVFTLAQMPARALAVGDSLLATAGCDKSLDTCSGKFANALNFRGCPFMPGNDSLIAGAVKGT